MLFDNRAGGVFHAIYLVLVTSQHPMLVNPMQRSLINIALSMLVFAPRVTAQQNFDFSEPVEPSRAIQVMVHRGMAMASPENSASAIQMCIEDYCEWVEIDVRLTKDGRHVIIHNDAIDSTTSGKGIVEDLTVAELQLLDAGSWFAKRFEGTRLLTLAQALTLAKGKINLYLDCKQIDPRLLVQEVKAANMERQVVVFGSPQILGQVKEASLGTIPIMPKFRPKTMRFDEFVQQMQPAAVEIDADDVTIELSRQFHARGIKVQAKVLGETWDTPQIWAQVIDAGADWLQTDDPVGVLFLNARRKLKRFPVKIAAHRGLNRYAPENSLAAIQCAARAGMDFAEIDIRTTLDGHHVLLHDARLDRTTDGQGLIRQKTFEEIGSLSAGKWFSNRFHDQRIPSFDAGLSEFGEKMCVYLDAKDIAPEAILAGIRSHHLEGRHVVYQGVEYCDALKKLDPKVRTLPPLKSREQLPAVAAIHPYGVDAAWSILSRELIADCHGKGIQVFSDALGGNENIEQYQAAIRWGIDCIQTDHPLRVLRAIELIAVKESQ